MRRTSRLVTLALLFVCLAAPARRAERVRAGEAGGAPRRMAVVLGVSRYRHAGLPRAQWAERDATAVAGWLGKVAGCPAEDILLVLDPTLAELNALFGTRDVAEGRLKRRAGAETELFVYYSGHGAPDLREGQAGYLVPADADPDYLPATGYPLELLLSRLGGLGARSVTVVLDACFSGGGAGGEAAAKGTSPAVLRARAVEPPPGVVVMASAGANQVSTWLDEEGHGLFTYLWLTGASGAADADRNRAVTVAELAGYLAARVPAEARRLSGREQTPVVRGPPGAVVVKLGGAAGPWRPAPLPEPAVDTPAAKASTQAEAEYERGNRFARGDGANLVRAVECYRRAALFGHPAARNNLGVAYEQGRGVPQDYVQAHLWFNLAAAELTGEEREVATRNRSLVERKMAPGQLAEAQRLARQWAEGSARASP